MIGKVDVDTAMKLYIHLHIYNNTKSVHEKILAQSPAKDRIEQGHATTSRTPDVWQGCIDTSTTWIQCTSIA